MLLRSRDSPMNATFPEARNSQMREMIVLCLVRPSQIPLESVFGTCWPSTHKEKLHASGVFSVSPAAVCACKH
jgi:hypothetical protein